MKRCKKYNGGEVGGLLTASLGVKPSVEGRRLLHCVRNDGARGQIASLGASGQIASLEERLSVADGEAAGCGNLTGLGELLCLESSCDGGNLTGLGENLTALENLSGLGKVALVAVAMFIAATSCGDGRVGGEEEEIQQTTTVTSGAQVGFRIQGGTPATYAYKTTVNTMDAFVVNGCVDSAGYNSRILFSKQTVTKVPGTTTFTYEPAVFIPKEATIARFAAYSPVSAVLEDELFDVLDPDFEDYNMIGYRTPNPGAGEVQQDLLVAYTVVKGKSNGQGSAAGEDLFSQASTVTLQFRHALSRIHVVATNAADDPVVITELSLNNLDVKAILDLDGNLWTGPGPDTIDINEGYYSSPTKADEYKTLWDKLVGLESGDLQWQLAAGGVAVPANTLTPVAVTAEDQALLVIPQITRYIENDEDKSFHLKVKYRLGNITAEKIIYYIDPVLNNEDISSQCAFEMGKQYNMRLDFTQTAIKFSVTVQEWPVAIETN